MQNSAEYYQTAGQEEDRRNRSSRRSKSAGVKALEVPETPVRSQRFAQSDRRLPQVWQEPRRQHTGWGYPAQLGRERVSQHRVLCIAYVVEEIVGPLVHMRGLVILGTGFHL